MAEQTRGFRSWLSPMLYLSSNWISATGVVLVTASAIFWIILVVGSISHETDNPYTGILLFIVAPAVFFLGLLLIPLGIWLRWRKEKSGGAVVPSQLPSLDLRSPQVRRFLTFLGVTTLANIIIAGHFSYSAIGYMDSTTFCGLTCHTVMSPEYSAYQNSPHARVDCTQCHIGPGASWFVKSKLSGAHQVLAVTFNTFERPIPSPVEDLRPARDTCEGCHWPQKYGGDRLRVIPTYAEDEVNSRALTVLMMRIGGGTTRRGIHGAHVGPGAHIRYAHTDRQRQNIPYVQVATEGQQPIEYFASDAKPEEVRNLPLREMDCIDCHNRPTHAFELAGRGVDRILNSGQASASLPYLKKTAVEVLKADYQSREEALRLIPERIEAFYREQHPEIYKTRLAEVRKSADAVRSVYERNIFPAMKVQWGTYINNIGHTDFPGCFRCHDDEHKAAGDKVIAQDCSSCHEMLAIEESDPKILSELGMKQWLR